MTYFRVLVRVEWILFRFLSFVGWFRDNKFLRVFWNFYFRSHLLLSRGLCQQIVLCTQAGERHLAPGFKHWSWFSSLSYASHFGPLSSGGAGFWPPLLLPDAYRKPKQNPLCLWSQALLSCAFLLLAASTRLGIWVSMCCLGVPFLHFTLLASVSRAEGGDF